MKFLLLIVLIALICLLILKPFFFSSRSPTRRCIAGANGSSDIKAPTTTSNCRPVPINDIVPSTAKDIIRDAINKQLHSIKNISYTVEIPAIKTSVAISSTSPMSVNDLVLDLFNSNICGNVLTFSGRMTLGAEGVEIKEENIGTTTFETNIVATMLVTSTTPVYAVQFQSIVVSDLTFYSTLASVSTWLVALTAPSLISYINAELVKVVVSSASPNVIVLPSAPTSEYASLATWVENRKMIDFLGSEMSDFMSSPPIVDDVFKICDTCPVSTLSSIQLGKTMWVEKKSDSTDCSWNYRAGINSIRGMNNFKLLSIELENIRYAPVISASDTVSKVTLTFSALFGCANVSIYVTAQAMPCSSSSSNKPAYIGVDDVPVTLPGNVFLQIFGAHITGTYDPKRKVASFVSNEIKIEWINFGFGHIPTDWAKVIIPPESRSYVQPFIEFITSPTQNILQTTFTSVVRESLNKQIKTGVETAIAKFAPSKIDVQL